MGENEFAPLPTALYGVVLLLAGVAWKIFQSVLVSGDEKNARLKEAIGGDRKWWLPKALYVAGIGLAFVFPWLAVLMYVAVAVIWFVPDRRYEKAINGDY